MTLEEKPRQIPSHSVLDQQVVAALGDVLTVDGELQLERLQLQILGQPRFRRWLPGDAGVDGVEADHRL